MTGLNLTVLFLVPTLRVGMQVWDALRLIRHTRRRASRRHSHAERGNEKIPALEIVDFRLGNYQFPPWKLSISALEIIDFRLGNYRFPPWKFLLSNMVVCIRRVAKHSLGCPLVPVTYPYLVEACLNIYFPIAQNAPQ
jgi:hypothetical protein